MRILTILTYYRPHWTGLTAHAVRVAEGLAARGHDVTVLTTRYRSQLPRDEMLDGVRVIRLRSIARFSRGMITPAYSIAAWKLIRQHDVVQIHSPLPEALLTALICRLLRKPMLMTHHGDLVLPSGLLNQIIQGIGSNLLLLSGLIAQRVTSYSQDYAQHSKMLTRLRDKLEYVYPPVEFPEPQLDAVQEWKSALGLDGKILIGFSGRWVEEKGFDFLLSAFPFIKQEIPNAHLVFTGEQDVIYENSFGRSKPLIEQLEGDITLLGLLRDPQKMANFYAMCDLFCLPSRTDMMALVQVEAMLCGTPVVASDIPGARVVVQETGFGQLAPVGDPKALAETIIRTLNARDAHRPNREAVRKVFNTERSLTQYEQILHSLARPGKDINRVNLTIALESGDPLNIPDQGTRRIRYRYKNSNWDSISQEDELILNQLLGNEADMAYRRRTKILVDYLQLESGDRVIDIGCGMGFYLMVMGKLRELWQVGFDTDMQRLRQAQLREVPAHLVSGKIENLPFAAESFDKVLLSEVLEHLAKDDEALAKIHRILRPGGILAISVPHADYPFLWDPISRLRSLAGLRPLREGPLVGIWTNHVRLYHPDQLVGTLEKSGFEIEILEEATHYAFPFAHFLVYGIGKPLLERNLLPRGLHNAADRFSAESNKGGILNPINLGVALFRALDKLNNRPAAKRQKTFVNVLIKARRR